MFMHVSIVLNARGISARRFVSVLVLYLGGGRIISFSISKFLYQPGKHIG